MATCNCKQYSKSVRSYADLQERCNDGTTILANLELVESDSSRWLSIYKCPCCSQYWANEYPFSEQHAGGPPCPYQIETNNPVLWLEQNLGITLIIRQRHEDQEFYNGLGQEIGPEKCRNQLCKRLKIGGSIYCKKHHFEMVFKRDCTAHEKCL